MPRILVLNANTTSSVTDLVMRHALNEVGKEVELVPATASFGARYISTEASYAIAAHSALDCLAAHCNEQGADCDAVLLACFGDPGLFALREVSPVPVVGLAEAAMREAATHGRYSIVTGGLLWKPMLERLAHALDLDGSIASIRPITWTGERIAADPDGALAFLAEETRRAAQEDGAQAVILGGAALAGLGTRVQPAVQIPVIDSVYAGARAAVALVRAPRTAPPAYPPTPTVGIGAPLARLLTSSS